MADQIPVTLSTPDGPEAVMLCAAGAIYWPRGCTLFIADPHFGKAASFHQAGIAVPGSLTSADLTRLDNLLQNTCAQRLVVLGDFFHARHGTTGATLDALAAWRSRHAALAIDVVLGNHDRHAGPPDASLRITALEAPYYLPPFALYHEPVDDTPEQDATGYCVAGHLHPRVVLHDTDGSSVRLPCFWIGERQAVLPAFGSFTGGFTIAPRRGDRVFVIAEGALFEARLAARR